MNAVLDVAAAVKHARNRHANAIHALKAALEAEFDARRGVVRCPACLEAAVRVTTARKLRQFSRDRAATPRPSCEGCGTTTTPRKHVRLNPRNLHDEHRLLCLPCGKKLGFQPVNHDRISANVHGREVAA